MDVRQQAGLFFPLMDLDDIGLLPSILSYLPYEDLNSLATCSRRLQTLRSNPELDPTRSGTLHFRKRSDGGDDGTGGDALARLVHAITHSCNPRSIFQENRTTLRLVGFVENLSDEALHVHLHHHQHSSTTGTTGTTSSSIAASSSFIPVDAISNNNVRHLDLSYERRPKDLQFLSVLTRKYISILGELFPNVETLNISHSQEIMGLLSRVKSAFPRLYSLSANHTDIKILLEHWTLRKWHSLRELYVQQGELHDIKDFRLPPNLERLDLWHVRDADQKPIPVAELAGILSRIPSLTWLRCEVSEEERLWLITKHPTAKILNY